MEIIYNSQNYNKNNICRICMQEDGNLYPIFKEIFLGNRTTTIAQIITECTKYPVTHNDQLPAQICNACMEAARNAHQFKSQTEEAYCQLKALYDITWIPKQEKGNVSGCIRSEAAATVRVSALTTDKYTQTEKSTVFQCECCPKKFFIESELRQHRATIHANDAKKCRVCGETFNHLGQLKVHLSTEHPSEGIRCDFKCNICSREFTRKDHLKRHLIRVHKIEDDKLNISKVSLDEPEIENPPQLSASLNNYSSHWPDYQEDDDNEATAPNETMAATNPFSSEDEGLEHHNFNDMDEEDVKQFVETIAHPEISIKVENPDYTDNISTSITKQEKLAKSINLSNETVLKPELAEENIEIKENAKEKEEEEQEEENIDNLNTSYQEHHSNNTSDEDTDEDYQHSSDDEDQDDKFETTKKPPKDNLMTVVKQEQNNEKLEIATSSKDKHKTKLKANTKTPRRRHGSTKNEDNRCKECNRTFTRYNHLLRHMLTHSDEKPHVCNFCGKGFSRSDHLQKHIQSIHCEKNYKCDQCSSAYGRKDHLQRHIETRHNKDPTIQKPQFDCDMCEKKFTTKAYLAKHKLLHTDRLYACKHCSETFTEKEQMKEHQKKKHAQPRNFLCNICGDSFQRNEYLKIHMRRHTGEKPYKCRFCEKGFPRSTDLKMHERYHIGHKPNLCNLCGKGFHRPYNLTIHMRTHTGEKPYKCNQCPQAFAQSNDLKAHIRRHTGERFRCDMCSAAFLQRYGLNAHLRTVHGIIVTSFTGRLRKTEQPIDGGGGGEQLDQTTTAAVVTTPPTQQLAPAQQEQSHTSLPSPHIDSTITPPPLYLGHHFIAPTVGSTSTSPPIDISSTSATTSSSLPPLPLAHPSAQQM
ncbi:zinc finger protein 420 [Lucilia cuprina]|uniref:zinc finger protein 420 n=1 Tax=Lucilia cuprina TaxID=7375 RepID=UPI001F066619|nr:zinc finger protein 420 [Lucilia cuprina]